MHDVQDRRQQGAGMAHADPENEGRDVEAPDMRIFHRRDTETGAILNDLAIATPEEQGQGAEENEPKQRPRALEAAHHIGVDLGPGNIGVDVLGLGYEAPFGLDFCLVMRVCHRRHCSRYEHMWLHMIAYTSDDRMRSR